MYLHIYLKLLFELGMIIEHSCFMCTSVRFVRFVPPEHTMALDSDEAVLWFVWSTSGPDTNRTYLSLHGYANYMNECGGALNELLGTDTKLGSADARRLFLSSVALNCAVLLLRWPKKMPTHGSVTSVTKTYKNASQTGYIVKTPVTSAPPTSSLNAGWQE